MSCPIRQTVLSLAVSASLAGSAFANPSGPQVAHGSASFAQPGPGQLHVTNSPGTIINWQGFSIGANELTRFIQQNSGSAVLNRVVGGVPSEILGQLVSNGRVFLINPNGLAIGNGAKIDTAGFLASTLNISDADFLAGRLHFAGGGGKIENRGFIRAGAGGEVVLLAPDIENSGIIQADNGKILLAAGREITLASLDLEGVQFRVQAPSDRVLNLGELIAQNGAVGVFAGTLTHSGSISATRATRGADGLVRLEAGDRAEVFGSIDVSGSGDAPGGQASVAAPTVALRGASINASGNAGGGTVLVGGDYQGGGTLRRSLTTDVDAATSIHADATNSGPGGKVVIWSDGDTRTRGLLTARGGPQGGDGGLIETSGKRNLEFSTPADVSAPKGRPGTWLLDPEDITIDGGKAASIESALNQGSSVSIKTTDGGSGEGDITVASAITKTEGGKASLSLTAHRQIAVNAPIASEAGKLNVSLKAGQEISVNSAIRTNGGRYSSTLTGEKDRDGKPPKDGGTSASDKSATNAGVGGSSSGANSKRHANAGGKASSATTQQTVALSSGGTPPAAAATAGEPAIRIGGEVTTKGGDIFVDAGDDGTTYVRGTLDASNRDAGGKGGNVTLLGDKVGLFDQAKVDASGDAGGGKVLIGGDRQGLNPAVRNASAVFTGPETSVKADALTHGDGGRIIVFADIAAQIHGQLSARGGAEGGDGGFIETSGLEALILDTVPDVSAPKGKGGEWLIDPHFDITIDYFDGSNNASTPSGSSPATWYPTDTPSEIDVFDIQSFFVNQANATLTITTENADGTETGNIIWNGAMDTDGFGSGDTLNLKAGGNITFHAAIFDSNYSGDSLNLNLTANVSGTGGAVTFNAVFTDSGEGSYPSLDTGTGNVTSNVPVSFLNNGADVNGDWRIGGNLVAPSVTVDESSFFGCGSLHVGGDLNTKNLTLLNDAFVQVGGNLNATKNVLVRDDSYLWISGNAAAGNVTLNDNAWMDVYGESLTVKHALTVHDNAWLYLDTDGTSTADMLNWTGGTISLVGNGSLHTNGAELSGDDKYLDGSWYAHGTTNWTGGAIFAFVEGSATIHNEDTFNAITDDYLYTDHVFINNGTFNKKGDGEVVFDGGWQALDYSFINNGRVNVKNGSMTVYDGDDGETSLPGYIQESGRTHLGGGTLKFLGCSECGPSVGVFEGGSLTGSGDITGDVVFTGDSSGGISPGNSPGVINISGNLTLAPNTMLLFEAAGTGPGQFDQINVGGTATLNGAGATVSFIDGFIPDVGDSFLFGTAAGGGFGSVFNPFNTPSGYALAPVYDPVPVATFVVNVLGVPPPPPAPPPSNGSPPPPPTGGGPTPPLPPPFPEGPSTDVLVLWYQEVWGEDAIKEDGPPEPRKLAMCR